MITLEPLRQYKIISPSQDPWLSHSCEALLPCEVTYSDSRNSDTDIFGRTLFYILLTTRTLKRERKSHIPASIVKASFSSGLWEKHFSNVIYLSCYPKKKKKKYKQILIHFSSSPLAWKVGKSVAINLTLNPNSQSFIFRSFYIYPSWCCYSLSFMSKRQRKLDLSAPRKFSIAFKFKIIWV